MGYLHVSCHVSAIFSNNSHPNTPGYINWSAARFCRVCSCSRVNSSHWAMEVPMHERLQLINHVVNRVRSDRKLILLNITHNPKIWVECLKIGDLPLKDRLSQWEGDDGFHRVRFATSFQAPNLGSQSRNHPNNKFFNDIKTLNPSKASYDGQWEVLHCALQVSSRTPKTGLLGTAFIQALWIFSSDKFEKMCLSNKKAAIFTCKEFSVLRPCPGLSDRKTKNFKAGFRMITWRWSLNRLSSTI